MAAGKKRTGKKALRKVGIIGNSRNPGARQAALAAIQKLDELGIVYEVDKSFGLKLRGKKQVSVKNFKNDLVFVFGGDGTLLYAILNIGTDIPVMGINCGQYGYLMACEKHEFLEILPSIVKGRFVVEERLRLKAGVKGMRKNLPAALNEIVISPPRNVDVMKHDLYVDGRLVWKDFGDGLIIASPTGSTGYALSSGGPVLRQGVAAIEIVPINSMDPGKRPLVVSENSKIRVCVHGKKALELVIDGQERFGLPPPSQGRGNPEIEITRGKPVRIARKK